MDFLIINHQPLTINHLILLSYTKNVFPASPTKEIFWGKYGPF